MKIATEIVKLEQIIKDINSKSDFAPRHPYVTKYSLMQKAKAICNTMARLPVSEYAKGRNMMAQVLTKIEAMQGR